MQSDLSNSVTTQLWHMEEWLSSVSKTKCALNQENAALSSLHILLQLKQHGCPGPDIEDVPMAEAANDINGLACRDAFALQHVKFAVFLFS